MKQKMKILMRCFALTIVILLLLTGCIGNKTDLAEENNVNPISLTADDTAYEKICDSNNKTYAEIDPGDSFTVNLKSPEKINTITLREKGSDCELFNIYCVDSKGNKSLIYTGDIIDDYLYCSFKDTQAVQIIFEVEKADKTVKLCDISAYYKEKNNTDFRVHSYFAFWGNDDTYFSDRVNDSNLSKTFDITTDAIIIGNVYWNEDGTLKYPQSQFERELSALRQIIGERDVRIWVCILNPRKEDGTIDNNASVRSINKNLDKLTDNIAAFSEKYALDGIDFDWEYPRLPHVWSAYNKLLTNLKPKLEKSGTLLSSALGPWGNMMNDEAKEALDFVNVMSYDWAKNKRNNHAEFYTCHYFSAKYFLNHGFKKEQLVLGVPFYGSTTGDEYSQASYSSFEITDKGQNTGTLDGKEYYFNGYNTIYSKTAFTADSGFAGMMIWNGQLDCPYESEYSLFKAMEEAINNRVN